MDAAPPTLYIHGHIYVRVAPEGAATPAADGHRRLMTDPDPAHVSCYGHIYERGIQTYATHQRRRSCDCSLL